MSMQSPLLDVTDLSVRFDHPSSTTHILENISLHVATGESIGIVGESGSGKSVLARTIMGIRPRPVIQSITGTVAFNGHELTKLDDKTWSRTAIRSMAMIFQDPSVTLNPVIRIGHQVTEAAPPEIRRSPHARRKLAITLLASVHLPDPSSAVRRFPGELSGGQRQRVGIAAALAGDPLLLLADEPTTALDVTVQRQVLDLIDDLRRQRGMAMIHITHDLAALSGRTDRIAVMYAGRIVETGPSQTILTRPKHPYTHALLDSTPRLSTPRRPPLPQIEGSLPDLTEPRVGCAFAPRCRFARDICFTTPPNPTSTDAGHTVACWLPQRAQDTKIGTVE
ncbi:ABC transporter ATP-binding protein [Bacillus subtilis]|nr:ABC transporter ATP-binding protein [Bacillus subtilis]